MIWLKNISFVDFDKKSDFYSKSDKNNLNFIFLTVKNNKVYIMISDPKVRSKLFYNLGENIATLKAALFK